MIATITVALLALLAERALSVADLVIGWRGNLFLILEMLGYLVPHYMGLALPAALFLGILFTGSKLSRSHEFDALNASGVGLSRIVRPMILVTMLVAIFHFYLVAFIQPYSRYAYRSAIHTLTSVSFQQLLQAGRFVSLGTGTFHVVELDEDNRNFKQIFLFSEDPVDGNVLVTASHGSIFTGDPMAPIMFKLYDGVQQLSPAATKSPEGEVPAVPNVTLRFGEFDTDLGGREPGAFRARGEDERELTIPELFQLRGQDHGEILEVEISAELWGRMSRTLSILALPFLALPLSIARGRSKISYGFVTGTIALVGYHQVIKAGESFADDGLLPAELAVGLPAFLFAMLSLWVFYRARKIVPDQSSGWITRMLEITLRKLVPNRFRDAKK